MVISAHQKPLRQDVWLCAGVIVFSVVSCGCDRGASTSATSRAPATEAIATVPASMLELDDDGFCKLPSLTLANIEDCIAEMKREGVTQLRLGAGHHFAQTWKEQPELFRRICKTCPELTELSLTGWRISAVDFDAMFQQLPKLSSLSLSICRIQHESEKRDRTPLPQTNITSLSINSCHEVDNALFKRILCAMPKLQTLRFADSQTRESEPLRADTPPLDQLPELTSFSVSSIANEEIISRVLAESPKLTSLTITECKTISGEYWKIPETTLLESLSLRYCEQLSAAKVDELIQRSPKLKELSLVRCPEVSLYGLRLSHLTQLRSLLISDQQIHGDFVASALPSLTRLRSLSLNGIFSKNCDPLDLSELQQLKSLSLGRCSKIDESLSRISDSVESLKLSDITLSNTAVSQLLDRLVNLRDLTLDGVSAGFEDKNKDDVVTGEGWDFTRLSKLRHIKIANCRHVNNDLICRIATQIPSLESLSLSQTDQLTGRDWYLGRSNLKHLVIRWVAGLQDELFRDLPQSLQTVSIVHCPKVTGAGFDFRGLTQLREIYFYECPLTSLGPGLPQSLEKMSVHNARTLTGGDLKFSAMPRLKSISLNEAQSFDTDRLFAALPIFFPALEFLDLTACPDLSSTQWDLSPMKSRLVGITYCEGEPSYVGGISDANARRLRNQLPDTHLYRQ